MPLATTTWKIPYATGGDAPCTGGDTIDAMADAVDAALVAFNFDLDRVLTVPYASIQDTVVQTYSTNISGFGSPNLNVAYDTVLADTEVLTNLATLPLTINIPSTRPGYWLAMTDPQQWTQVAFGSDSQGTVINWRNQTGNVSIVRTAGYATVLSNIMGASVAGMLAVDASTGDVQVYTNVFAINSGQPVATVTGSYLMAMWVADE